MKKKIKIQTKPKTSLGIDISSTSMAMALLKQDKHGIHLVRAARRPLPEGLIKGGTLNDPRLLRKMIGDFRRKCGRTRLTTLSLSCPRAMVQIMDVPNHVSMNLGQYVQKELKHYVTLAGVKTVSDYRTLDSNDESKRVFVAVGDHKCVASAVKACEATGLDVHTVEPSLVAYARALYDKTLAHQSGSNVVLAIIRDNRVCLAVWQDRIVRFIRCHSLDDVKDTPGQTGSFLASKIKTIMQYYEVEVEGASNVWRIDVVTDHAASFPEEARTQLCEAMGKTSVDVITSENLEIYCSVDLSKEISRDQISISAIGYAMNPLIENPALPQVNLLPMQIREEKDVKYGMLLTAVGASVVLLFLAILTIAIAIKTKEVNARIAIKKPQGAVGEAVMARSKIEMEIEQVGKIPTELKTILSNQKSVNWSGVLSDISSTRPKGICLTSMDSRNDYEVYIQGKALTYSDVTTFVTRLGQAANIASANLTKTDHKSGYNSHHVYEIKCQLKTTTGI
jgi:Na+-transporting methylmalonyl-CoA/oxaloacetate decarboxylase gamma subunit